MRFRDYTSTPDAIAQAKQAGICGDIARRLSRMARRAAPFTAANANRRFNEFGLRIEADRVVGVSLIAFDPA